MSLERAIGFFHPDDRAAVRGHLEKALEERSGFHFTARIIRADGRITVLESSGTVVMDRLNNMVGVVGVVRDFSRMQTENMLLRHYNEITSEEGLGVYSYDIRNGVNYWNPTLYDLLGVDRTAQPEIETALRHLAPSSAEKVRGLLKAAMTEGEGFEFEGEIARNGGERIPYRSKCQVVHDEAGEISHVFGVLRRLE